MEKLQVSMLMEKEHKSREEEEKLAETMGKNSKFSYSLLESDIVGVSKKEKGESLPRLHDRYPSSLKNYRYMLLKNRQLKYPDN